MELAHAKEQGGRKREEEVVEGDRNRCGKTMQETGAESGCFNSKEILTL